MKGFLTALYEELGKRAAFYLTMVIGSGAVGGVYFWDPFYHAGWILTYKGWIGVLVVVCAIAIAASHVPVGLTVVTIAALTAATAFGYLYKNPQYQHSEWPFWTWLLHLLLVSLTAGILVGGGSWLVKGRSSKQAPKPRGGPKQNLK